MRWTCDRLDAVAWVAEYQIISWWWQFRWCWFATAGFHYVFLNAFSSDVLANASALPCHTHSNAGSGNAFYQAASFTSTVQVLAEISDKLEDDSVLHVSSVSADVVLGVFRDSGQSEMSVE